MAPPCALRRSTRSPWLQPLLRLQPIRLWLENEAACPGTVRTALTYLARKHTCAQALRTSTSRKRRKARNMLLLARARYSCMQEARNMHRLA
eukprot:247619-Alexandrium_andersonii.AAC.1